MSLRIPTCVRRYLYPRRIGRTPILIPRSYLLSIWSIFSLRISIGGSTISFCWRREFLSGLWSYDWHSLSQIFYLKLIWDAWKCYKNYIFIDNLFLITFRSLNIKKKKKQKCNTFHQIQLKYVLKQRHAFSLTCN